MNDAEQMPAQERVDLKRKATPDEMFLHWQESESAVNRAENVLTDARNNEAAMKQALIALLLPKGTLRNEETFNVWVAQGTVLLEVSPADDRGNRSIRIREQMK